MSFLQSQTYRSPGSSFFDGASIPIPQSIALCEVFPTVPSGVVDIKSIPFGGYLVLGPAYNSPSFMFQFTGTPSNKMYWLIQSNCLSSISIILIEGTTQTTIGSIQAIDRTPGKAAPSIGVITYQNGAWAFY